MDDVTRRGWGRAMGDGAQAQVESSILEIAGLSEWLAEYVLATTWCVLEQHVLSTPSVEVRMAVNLIELRLTFGSANDRALVEQRLLEKAEFRYGFGSVIILR
jgi:hypothetical protein